MLEGEGGEGVDGDARVEREDDVRVGEAQFLEGGLFFSTADDFFSIGDFFSQETSSDELFRFPRDFPPWGEVFASEDLPSAEAPRSREDFFPQDESSRVDSRLQEDGTSHDAV